MKYTVLEMTQRILGSMESDEVSSINDTPESYDVANIIKECFFDIVGQGNFAEQENLFKLTASGDNTKPTLMTVPEHVIRIDWLKYNKEQLLFPEFRVLMYMTPDEFVQINGKQDEGDPWLKSFTQSINGTTFTFKYRNDRYPTYYTILDEKYVIFDSFDANVEDTLTQIRSLGYGLLAPQFLLEDDFIPDLDHRQFQLLLQDAKSTAHVELKQQPNQKAEQKYRRNWILSQKTKHDNDPAASRQKAITFGRNPFGYGLRRR